MLDLEKLSVEKQVEFINDQLKNLPNMSVNKVCQKFGLKESTIKTRFGKANFKFDVVKRKYIKETHEEVLQSINVDETVNMEIAATKTDKNLKDDGELLEIKKTLEEVKELLEMKSKIKEVIKLYEEIEVAPPKDNKLEIDRGIFADDLTNRVMRVYTNVNVMWQEFCKDNKQYKMQDLYSQALYEFIEKYKK